MPWWRFGREREATPPEVQTAEPRTVAPQIREAERRSLTRLIERQRNLEYDIDQAETAFLPANRWTERMSELDEAIAQAETDLAAIRPTPAPATPLDLPDLPILVASVRTRDPAEVRLDVGGQSVLFREEPDWAERGHQLALPQLTLAEGDIDRLIPASISDDERQRLERHLLNSLAILADEALERAVDGEELPAVRLPELARPCDKCGGWLDVKGRCPACVELDRQRDEIRTALTRLLKERGGVAQDLALARDRLPVFRRQLSEVEQDIAKLRAKGVQPL